MGNTVGRQNYISNFQKEVIIGCLLGDGRLESRSSYGSARLRIHHGEKQKRYVFWKYNVLKNIVSARPRKIICGKNPRNGKNYYSWYFHTKTLPEFSNLYKIFYRNRKKILPFQLDNMLSPISLAVWIMDDGCSNRESLILNTQNYSLDEHERLIDIFRRKLGFIPTINKDRDRFRLRFKKVYFQNLIEIVKPYIIPSMRYKILSP